MYSLTIVVALWLVLWVHSKLDEQENLPTKKPHCPYDCDHDG